MFQATCSSYLYLFGLSFFAVYLSGKYIISFVFLNYSYYYGYYLEATICQNNLYECVQTSLDLCTVNQYKVDTYFSLMNKFAAMQRQINDQNQSKLCFFASTSISFCSSLLLARQFRSYQYTAKYKQILRRS